MAARELECRQSDVVLRSIATLMVGLALWQSYNPYLGIWHDARIYVLGAVHFLTPTNYAEDLWFKFGSQDELTVFSPLLAVLVSHIGIAPAAMVTAWLGGVLWVVAAWVLCNAMLEGRSRFVAFVVLGGFPLDYGATMSIYVAESFATARPFAVGLTLLGLAVWIRGRRTWALPLFLMAIMLHPLMGVWGLLVVLAVRCSDRLLLGVALAVVAGTVLVALNPVALPVFHPMGGEWGDIVKISQMVVLLPWPGVRVDAALWSVGVLLWAGRHGRPELRRLYAIVALLAATGFLASLVGSYFLPVRLIIQLQAWRGMWLANVLAVVAAADMGARLLAGGSIGRSCLALAAASFLMRDAGGGLLLALAFVVLVGRPGLLVKFHSHFPVLRPYLLLLAGGAGLICLPGILADFSIRGGAPVAPGNDPLFMMRDGLTPLIMQLAPPLAAYGLLLLPSAAVASLLGATASIVALTGWDHRPSNQRYVEDRFVVGGYPGSFDGRVRQGQVGYWTHEGLRVWFELGAANYVSIEQHIGTIFSEGRTVELKRRWGRIAAIDSVASMNPGDDGRRMVLSKNAREFMDVGPRPAGFIGYEPSGMTLFGLKYLCADPALDFVVDGTNLPGVWSARQVAPALGRTVTYYLYECSYVRQQA